ncbi:helix-turn-helix domain-containing protein [Brevundimonas aveniformis]|uniref:helix-turn-helix domain-containing protein n=1 Tax=Brevundimonas aveniformis TaxID=370977 RepID=UPI00248F58B8|nr:helix-turn-helix transcriptional regulator [Brevundimonas aveniformis]
MARSADQKLFLGGRLKRLRRELDLTQTAMAADLEVSPSYLNHIERNQRPVSAQLLLRLADTYDVDLRAFGQGDEATAEALGELLADPVFKGLSAPRHEILATVDENPAIAEALTRLYQAFSDQRSRTQIEAERGGGGLEETPADWVRDLIQSRRNHFPEIDALGEAHHTELSGDPLGLEAALRARLKSAYDLSVRILPAEVMVEWTRRLDLHRRRLTLSETLSTASRLFAMAYQLGLSAHAHEIEAMAETARPPNTAAHELLKVSLTNALAGAILMPYGPFQALAEATGYDLDLLQQRFGVSFEQAAHRLTTLGRPTARGVPFFLMRVDQAGNVSKRYAAGAFPFSRFGGACPRWRLHAAFRTPGRVVTQIVETPDGGRWFTLARTVARQGAGRAGDQDLAISLGCELKDAHRLVYARGLNLEAPEVTPIGPACRLCPRHPCAERAAPPVHAELQIDAWSKSVSPWPFST